MSLLASSSSWEPEFERWLEPFQKRLRTKFRREMTPLYLKGLIAPGQRKSVDPMAQRVAAGKGQNMRHFLAESPWDADALEAELAVQADALVGGDDAVLIVDDTALRKKGRHSPGVARQYCGEVGKLDNCQSLVSLTLANNDIPVCIGLKLFLPEAWDADAERRLKCKIPAEERHREKWKMALDEIDRLRQAGVHFGRVLGDAGYGAASGFRAGLSERGLLWAVGIEPQQQVYPADVQVEMPPPGMGRPRKHPTLSVSSVSAREFVNALGEAAFERIAWRRGSKGDLSARFVARRIRMADGGKISQGQRLPGDETWIICEWRDGGERKYYASNFPPDAPLLELACAIKARWSCEQMHQQMKQELGLDHYEGRSWEGLRRHCILSMIAFCFLQHLRLRGKKGAVSRIVPVCRRCGGN
jgi:SRSO17 transposase